MGGTVTRVQDTVDGVAHDIGATLTTIANTVSSFQQDASDTIANITAECLTSLRIMTQRINHTSFLLTNAVLALTTAIALGILLHLTNAPFLRGIVWFMYVSLCFHMLVTYIRHSRSPPLLTSQSEEHKDDYSSSISYISDHPKIENKCDAYEEPIQYRNEELERIIVQSDYQSKIDLTDFILIDEDIEIVITQAINIKQCTILQLINCTITSNGALILALALSHNKTLEQLSLWNNVIGDMGAQALSNALLTNENNLKKLDLSNNEITDESAEDLAQMLKTNTMLTHLTLSRNNIGDKGVQELAIALQYENKTLQALSFTENKLLTDSSVNSFINMFKHNQTLKKLWIDDCNLSQNGRDKLRKAAKSKKDFDVYM